MKFKITLADHFGMCFGVRDALRKTHDLATSGHQVTVLGQLVHNPVVSQHLQSLGVKSGNLDDPPDETSEPSGTPAADRREKASGSSGTLVVTAHGASDRDRERWRQTGHRLEDTTCPLVRKAHTALAQLVASDFFPVVIGKAGHVEVRGLIGDFPHAAVVLHESDIDALPFHPKIGIVSQTTQPISRVQALVEKTRTRHPAADVRFIDTVCQPTKDRQAALDKLARENEVVIVIGGHNSNNTAQLARKAEALGARAYHIATPDELDPKWFRRVRTVGITAGTSTLDETVRHVRDRLQQIAALTSREQRVNRYSLFVSRGGG